MKISKILRYYLSPGRQIIQFSPVRSGSTLVFNLLRECLPGFEIEKTHTYSKHYRHLPIVATVRHPLDCIASLLLVKEYEITETNLRWAVDEVTRLGGADLARLSSHPRCLLLRYEDFVADYETLYDAFERFFAIAIPADQRVGVTSRFNRERVGLIAAQQGTFASWDDTTQIHGKHISAFNGQPFYHKELFNPEQIDFIKPLSQKLLATFGYDE